MWQMLEHIYIADVEVESKFYFNVDSLTNNSLWYMWLIISICNLKNMFINDSRITLGHGFVYGFLEPQSIHNAKDRLDACQHYIETWLKESQREVYLGIYLNQ